jgi:membrane peptidoglycan carboxypeptidase
LVRQLISYSARTPQQVVDATEHSPARKVREMKYAIALEKKLSKEQILERYLNIAPYGHGAYGIFGGGQSDHHTNAMGRAGLRSASSARPR